MSVESVSVEQLQEVLGFRQPLQFPEKWRDHPLGDWSMEPDDVVLRYIFRGLDPLRHLEFGTWLGDGVLRCVEECGATVWTINVLEGESTTSGEWAYATRLDDLHDMPLGWTESLTTDGGVWVRTDAYGAIGRKYLAAGWGRRVCQIYCDSRQWDTRAYADGFFDSVFIDGGHAKDIVEHDTNIATRLVRSGGLVMWHDFCPRPDVCEKCPSTVGTTSFVSTCAPRLLRDFRRLFWIEPSWLLLGIRR